MRTGFMFKGIHSNSMGITIKTKSRPILPDIKRITFEPSSADGVIDLSKYNEWGRVMYQERVFQLQLGVKADNIYKLQLKIAKLAAWLSGDGELIFDDIPAVKWKASITDAIDYVPELSGRKTILIITFKAEPFSLAMFDTQSGIPIGSKIPIGSVVPIGIESYYTYSISGNGNISVNNLGTAPVRPQIIIYEPNGTVTIGCGGKQIEIRNSDGASQLVIDSEKFKVFQDGNERYYDGDFFELSPGNNNISVKIGANTSPKTVKVNYVPRFLYSWEVE